MNIRPIRVDTAEIDQFLKHDNACICVIRLLSASMSFSNSFSVRLLW